VVNVWQENGETHPHVGLTVSREGGAGGKKGKKGSGGGVKGGPDTNKVVKRFEWLSVSLVSDPAGKNKRRDLQRLKKKSLSSRGNGDERVTLR